MIPPFVAEIGMKYGTKILAGFLAIGIAWGGYAYWEHKQEKEGMRAERADWMDREAKINAKSEAIIALKQYEFERDTLKFKQEKDNELNQYHQYSQKLERDLADSANKRLLVRSKANNQICSDSGKGSGDIPQGNTQRGQASDWSELAESDSLAIQVTAIEAQKMANICAQALGFIERNGLVE